MKEVWGLWLSEISSFSSIPGFFEQFFSERQYQTILFEIISGKPDADTVAAEKDWQEELERWKRNAEKKKQKQYGGYGYNNKKDEIDVPEKDNPWIEKQLNVVKFSYSIVQKIFDMSNQDQTIIEKFLENGTVEKLIEWIGHLTGDKGRKRVEVAPS